METWPPGVKNSGTPLLAEPPPANPRPLPISIITPQGVRPPSTSAPPHHPLRLLLHLFAITWLHPTHRPTHRCLLLKIEPFDAHTHARTYAHIHTAYVHTHTHTASATHTQDGVCNVQYSARTKCNKAHVGIGLGLVGGEGVRCLIHDGGAAVTPGEAGTQPSLNSHVLTCT